MSGLVVFVGAGPGAPDLITVRGAGVIAPLGTPHGLEHGLVEVLEVRALPLRQLAGVESTERWLAAHGEAFGDALTVVFEPVGHEQRLAVGRLHEVFERVELAVVHHYGVTAVGVDRAGGQL